MNGLSALQALRPIQTPDYTKRPQMLAAARGQQQQQRLAELQIQGEESEVAAAQQAREKAMAVHQVLAKHRGNIDEALPEIFQLDAVLGNALAKTSTDLKKGEADVKNVESQISTREADSAETRRKNAAQELMDRMKAEAEAKKPISVTPGMGLVRPGEDMPFHTQPFAPKDPMAGRDIPLSPEVERQQIRMANQTRAAQDPIPQPVNYVDADGKPAMGLINKRTGQIEPMMAGGQPARPVVSSQNRPPTEGERTALRFYERMKGAADDLAKVEEKIAAKGLAGQAALKLLPNILQPEENQLYQQAQRAFTESRLRKDSGAAIPEYEFENDRRMYFAQPGDSKAVLEQKRKSRETAMAGLRRSAARAYEETYGESPNSDVQKGPADPLGIR